jgi:hypothetical protein
MKQFFPLATAILCANMLFAQHSVKLPLRQAAHRRALAGLLQQNPAAPMQAGRTTGAATMERIIAQSKRDNTMGNLVDSVNLKYSSFRTSAYDYNTMVYPYNYPYSSSPMFANNEGAFTKPQVLCDTYRHWEVDPNTLVYGFYESGYASYSASGNLTGYLYLNADSTILVTDGFSDPNMLYANKFNAANNIDSGYWFNWQSGAADSAFKQFFTYNTSNKLTKDSTYEYHLGAWRMASRTIYTYDGSGNLIQIDNYANDTDTSFTQPLVEMLKYINTYDASHRLLTISSSFYDQDSLLPYIKDTFAYSGAYTYHNAWREYQYDPINRYWAPMFNMTKAINLPGLPDTVYIDNYDSIMSAWVPQTMDVISYNSYHNPDTLQDYEYNFTAFPSTSSFTTVYYYGTYINTTAVQGPASLPERVLLFPNPATGPLTVTGLDVPANTFISVSVINGSGQMVSRERMLWLNEATISTGGLMPGVYWLTIQDGPGNTICSRQFVKQ